MIEGEKKHGPDEWKKQTMGDQIEHLKNHVLRKYFNVPTGDDDITHAMTRCAMIKYLEAEKQISNINSHEEVES